MTETDVSANAFDLIFAFDEIIALGYPENVNLAQVRTYTEMHSHDEAIYKMVKEVRCAAPYRLGVAPVVLLPEAGVRLWKGPLTHSFGCAPHHSHSEQRARGKGHYEAQGEGAADAEAHA
jgi:hypothetical protein